MDDEVELSFALEGKLEVGLASGATVLLRRVEARFAGTFGRPEAPFSFTIAGALGDLRKIAAVNPSVADLLPAAADHPDAASGEIELRAEGAKLRALKDAAEGTPDLDARALAENERWIVELFTFEGYLAESVSVVTSTSG